MSEEVDCGVTQEQAKADHEFLKEWKQEMLLFLEERRRSRERWEKVRVNVIGGLILSALAGVASFLYWVGSMTLQAIQSGQHPQ